MKEIKATNQEPQRINVFLRDEGVGSRRTIDSYVQSGLITINKKLATLGSKVSRGDVISFKTIAKDMVYALYHKPRGEVTGKLDILP